jgi:head-tail adaptor
MMWKDVIELIQPTTSRLGNGEVVEGELIKTEVYANKKSVRQSEFYQALASGVRPEIVFEVLAEEYTDQPQLSYEDTTYYIIRTFTKTGEKLELICSRYPMMEG